MYFVRLMHWSRAYFQHKVWVTQLFGIYWNARVKKREAEVDDWTTLSQVQACWSKECVNIQSREVSFFPCSHLTSKETLGNLVVFFSRSNQTCCCYLLQTLVKFSPVTSLPTNFVIVPFFFPTNHYIFQSHVPREEFSSCLLNIWCSLNSFNFQGRVRRKMSHSNIFEKGGSKGRRQWKKNAFFRALPKLPKPPPLTPIRATWSFFSDIKIQNLKVTCGEGREIY